MTHENLSYTGPDYPLQNSSEAKVIYRSGESILSIEKQYAIGVLATFPTELLASELHVEGSRVYVALRQPTVLV